MATKFFSSLDSTQGLVQSQLQPSLAYSHAFVSGHLPDDVWEQSHPLIVSSTTLFRAKHFAVKGGNGSGGSSPVFQSHEFKSGGVQWRMLFMPKGHFSDSKYVSFYLERVSDLREGGGSVVCAQFALVIGQSEGWNRYQVQAKHAQFTNLQPLQGFTHFFDLQSNSRQRQRIEDRSIVLFAYVRVLKDDTGEIWKSYFGDSSRRHTGFTGIRGGLQNSSLSSVVQMLYHITPIRKAVEAMESAITNPSGSLEMELRQIFVQMRGGEQPTSSSELQVLMGVDVVDSSNLLPRSRIASTYRALFDCITAALKGTNEGAVIARLFTGKTRDYTCTSSGLQYEISTTKEFDELELYVEGEQSLHTLLSAHTRSKAYSDHIVNQHGFLGLPPLLRMRVEYHPAYHDVGNMVTSVLLPPPEILDLAEWVDPATHEHTGPPQQWVYHLHALVRHDVHRDLYHTFIKPGRGSEWVRFSGARVFKESPIGGGSSAQRVCYLTYVRESLMDVLIAKPESENNVHPPELDSSDEHFQARQRDSLFKTILIASDATFANHRGLGVADFTDVETRPSASWKTTHIFRWELFDDFLERLAMQCDISKEQVQLWFLTPRADTRQMTLRKVNVPTTGTQGLACEQLRINEEKMKVLYVRASPTCSASQPVQTVMIFLKAFDLQKQAFFWLGSLEVDRESKVSKLMPSFITSLEWPEEAKTMICREFKGNLTPLHENNILSNLAFVNGDIVCVLVDQGMPFRLEDKERNYDSHIWFVDDKKRRFSIGNVRFSPHEPYYCRDCGSVNRCDRNICQWHWMDALHG